mmetsp:Transcript_6989/g.16132  ORF Transcript_6989/g.16132 Transcript_6989/m.16132 type:complete len:347 (-) Transcript_6989:2734-3774(-)
MTAALSMWSAISSCLIRPGGGGTIRPDPGPSSVLVMTSAKSRTTTARLTPFPALSESVSWNTAAKPTKHRRRHVRNATSAAVAKLRSTSRTTELAKLRILDASSRLVLHCSTRRRHAGELSVQLRLRDRSMPPATRRASGEFPHPLTMILAWAKTGLTLGRPLGRLPAAVRRSLTASCSEKIRTNTSWVIPGPTRPGTRVVMRTRWGVSSKLLFPSDRVPKRNHLASSILQTSSRQMRTRRERSSLARSSFMPSSSPPWKERRDVASPFFGSALPAALLPLPGGSLESSLRARLSSALVLFLSFSPSLSPLESLPSSLPSFPSLLASASLWSLPPSPSSPPPRSWS